MGKVSLEGLEFFAFHGFYEEEQKIGNRYSVDITVTTDFDEGANNDLLEGTVNYEQLYHIIEEEMKVSSKLLEHVGKRITTKVFGAFSKASNIHVIIYKHNPPIGGVCRFAKVELEEERKESADEVEDLISNGEEFGLPKAPNTDNQLRISEDFFSLSANDFED